MKKLIYAVLLLLFLLAPTNTLLAKEEEPNSIDSVTAGVADTDNSIYAKKEDKEIRKTTAKYSLAVLPYLDTSGLEGRSREMAANAVKDSLNKKYKKTNVTIASAKNVVAAMNRHPFENTDTPILEELVAIGKDLGVDRVIYVNMMPAREKESGVMIIMGTSTASAVISMKLKCVDVNAGKYIFNQIVEETGSSSSINFWKIGAPSPSKAVKRGTIECMTVFLTSFD